MKMRDFLEQWGLTSLKINVGFLEGNFAPQDPDRAAAWDLYVELLTRITTQSLSADEGDEKAALDSIYAIFGLTREILRKHGSGCGQFAKIAVPVLNQLVRPFTARWHRRRIDNAFESAQARAEFRAELEILQGHLRHFMRSLSAMAEVEDLTALEEANS